MGEKKQKAQAPTGKHLNRKGKSRAGQKKKNLIRLEESKAIGKKMCSKDLAVITDKKFTWTL